METLYNSLSAISTINIIEFSLYLFIANDCLKQIIYISQFILIISYYIVIYCLLPPWIK